MTELTTIATFSFPYEAQIARASLESAGIPAEVVDEHTINMQWLYGAALGGVKVKVPAELVGEALDILATDYSAELNQTLELEPTTCIQCGSADVVAHTRGRRPAFVVFLLLGFPLFFVKHGIKCNKCNHFWQT